MSTIQRRDELKKVLAHTLQFVGEHVIGTLVHDPRANVTLNNIPEAYRPYFQQEMSSEQFSSLLLREIKEESSSAFSFLDDYATSVLGSPDHELLTSYAFRGGLLPWCSIRAALLEACAPLWQEMDVAIQEAVLERASALLLWSLADAIVERATDQHGWYYLTWAVQNMPVHMQEVTPFWLRKMIEMKRPELLFSELSVFPLSERVVLFVDDLALAGQVEFPDALCQEWGIVRSALKRVYPLSERTFAYTEVFALDDEQHAREFDDLCERNGLPRTFTKREQKLLAQPLTLSPYLVDMADLDLLSATSGPSLSDWLLDTGVVQEAVRVRVRLGEDVALLAEGYRRAQFAVCEFPEKLLVQLTRAVQVVAVREGRGCLAAMKTN